MAPKTVLPSKFAEYSVGWICAQQSEFVAARAMLDVEHGVPAGRGPADSNTYFLGSIGGHNVVIACLPAGAAGAAPAATVAASMQCTFGDVGVGLLVGVGSGAPTDDDDVRLGDVVVGVPTADTGGVGLFERDLAEAGGADVGGSDGGFVRSRGLNAPPCVLLTALNNLMAEHVLNGNRAADSLAQAAQKFLLAKAQFAVPVVGSGSGRGGGGGKGRGGEETDRLYQADYVHVGKRGSGGRGRGAAMCGMCDNNMLVQRPQRELDERVVHYGVIASGDNHIECGVARDRTQEVLGAICFEREAAGLMNNFPYLVIRGICDYADTHKSVLWQGYAAATATAYTKELLEYMPPQEVQ
jgi:nucleoside phosphorylase